MHLNKGYDKKLYIEVWYLYSMSRILTGIYFLIFWGFSVLIRIIEVAGGVFMYHVLSRSKAKALSYSCLARALVIISITDIDSSSVIFAKNEQIKAILRLSFNDVDRGCFGAMNENDAESIVHFCNKWILKADLLVHCEAGISRSAGVCAAIMKWYEKSDMPIFGNAYYRPNMHCYREVLKAFERSIETDREHYNGYF